MVSARYSVAVLILAATGCGGQAPTPTDSATAMARTVTIYRDRYGVPYVHGPTDASAVFGFAYAQAEDHFSQVEDSYIHALGRAAEAYGASKIAEDWLNRALEVASLSRAEYERLGPRPRQLCDAFAAGLNYFLASRTEVKPRLLTRFESWHVLALLRHRRHQRESVEVSGLSPAELKALGSGGTGGGSNGLAVGPSKSAAGGAMLIGAPHRQFFGEDQFYEGHLRSDEGWRLWGTTFVGLPFPHLGFNEQLAWTHTGNRPDIADLYIETFDRPAQPADYRYGDTYRAVRTWTDEIRVRTDTGMATRRLELRKTHHGPLVVVRDGKHLALKLAKIEEGGMLEQWYAMSRARSLEEFRTALARLGLPYQNTIYADAAGNILYVYGGAIPRRSKGFDWSQPVDGSNPETEWQGYHRLDELPQVLNPSSGYVQNCNSSPFTTTSAGNPTPGQYPAYMFGPQDGDLRASMARRVLSRPEPFTFDEWQRVAVDSGVATADQEVPRIVAEWRQRGSDPHTESLRPLVRELEVWDRRSHVDSIAATLFFRWGLEFFDDLGTPKEPRAPLPRIRALTRAKTALEQEHGTWRVPWGEVNRLQRVQIERGESFSDQRPSLPLAGGPGFDGVLFSNYKEYGQRGRYVSSGQSFAFVVAFRPELRAVSVHVFGQSSDPHSPHYFDQAPLFSEGKMKPVWTTIEQIRANAVRAYHPGAIDAGR